MSRAGRSRAGTFIVIAAGGSGKRAGEWERFWLPMQGKSLAAGLK